MVIDIHTHIVPASFPAYAGRHTNVRWPQMAAGSDCHHCNVMIAGKVFRTVTDECWSIDRRLEAMDRSRVARQVLSPMPELLSYWLAPEDALPQLRAREWALRRQRVGDDIDTALCGGRSESMAT